MNTDTETTIGEDPQDAVMSEPAAATSDAAPEEVAEAAAKTTTAKKETTMLDLKADLIIRNHQIGAVAAGFIPLPFLDLAALVGVQLDMLRALAGAYEVPFRKEIARSAVGALIGTGLPGMATMPLATSLAKFVPGYGQTVAIASSAVLNGAFTYAVGRIFVQHFASGGTFLTFDPKAVRKAFAWEFKKGKKVTEEIKEEAVAA